MKCNFEIVLNEIASIIWRADGFGDRLAETKSFLMRRFLRLSGHHLSLDHSKSGQRGGNVGRMCIEVQLGFRSVNTNKNKSSLNFFFLVRLFPFSLCAPWLASDQLIM